MATVDGCLVDVISYDAGRGESSTGRFITVGGNICTLAVHDGPLFLIRARDSGVGGTVYVAWVSADTTAGPPTGLAYTGPLVDKTATRLLPRRAGLPLMTDAGEIITVD